MMPVPAPEAAGEACTPRAADAAKAGPLPSSSALAVGAAKELGTPIGDGDASPDEATQQAEGDRAAARLQARVRGHQSRLGSTTPFVEPVKEFDAPPGAGTPNQRGAFETRRQAVDDAVSVAKVDATLNEVGATRKEDGASSIATVDGWSPQVERVVALQMARTRGPPPLGPRQRPFSAHRARRCSNRPCARPRAVGVQRARATSLTRRTFATELRRRATSTPDDRTGAARCPLRRRGRAERPARRPRRPRPTVEPTTARRSSSCEAWHRRKRDEARARANSS